MKYEDKKEMGECLFKPSNFKVWFIDNQWFNSLLTVILDNSGNNLSSYRTKEIDSYRKNSASQRCL
jgi:hypothetical protein